MEPGLRGWAGALPRRALARPQGPGWLHFCSFRRLIAINQINIEESPPLLPSPALPCPSTMP